jgi:hypothetical protein
MAAWKSLIAKVPIAEADWSSDAQGAAAYKSLSIPFPATTSLHFCYLNTGTAINDYVLDDEELHINFWYNRGQ